MTASASYVPLYDCDILSIANTCILIGYKSKTYWVPKHSLREPNQFSAFGVSHITVWVTQEYALEEGLCH